MANDETSETGGGGSPERQTIGTNPKDQATAEAVIRQVVREMMDDRDEARNVRMEALEARIASSLSKLDQIPTQSTQTWMIIAAAGGTVLLILGILQFARQEFFGASQFTASTYEQASSAKELSEKTAKQGGGLKKYVGDERQKA